jgi:polyhydroxyalkanoate synthesis regulator phasin
MENSTPNAKTEKYNQEKIELIKRNLEAHKELGQNKFYEIHVDGLRAVPRTDDITHFEDYAMYLSKDTSELKILLYQGNSFRTDKFIFTFENTNEPKQNLQTLKAEILQEIQQATLGNAPENVKEQLKYSLMERDLTDSQAKVNALKLEIEEHTEYIEILEKKVEDLQDKLYTSQQAEVSKNRLYEMTYALVTKGSEFVKRNPEILAKIPVLGETLAGDIIRQNAEDEFILKQQLLLQQEQGSPINQSPLTTESHASFSTKEQ